MTTEAVSEVGLDNYDQELDVGGIADLLSELSQSCQLPASAAPPEDPVPFAADEVDFSSNDWLQKILSVQCWLHLDAVVSAELRPEEAAHRLFSQLEVSGRSSDCFQVDGGATVIPSASGIQLLENLLSRARNYKQAFADAIDEDRSHKEASNEWISNWDEYEAPPRPPISITAEVAQWRIKDFKENAAEGLLDLNPSYQRDIVWSNAESQLLIESILRGIPLPSVILSRSADDRRWQIVDGKQRLTAILRFIGHHPDGRAFAEKVGALDQFDKQFRKFAKANHLKPKDISDNFLPFKTGVFKTTDPLHKFSGKYYSEIKTEQLTIGGYPTTIKDAFESIGSRYQVPVLLYRDTNINDIHHVFGLYNRQGKKLNAEELRNAVYHHVALMRLVLVLSGDRPQPDELAPYLPSSLRDGVAQIGPILEGYAFGTARFKRTKVLCWMLAVLLQEPREIAPDQLSTPSTASHINAMLDAASTRPNYPLAKEVTLTELARIVEAAVRLHNDAEYAWASGFRNKKGNHSKWEELPLIGSLLACMIVVAVGEEEKLHQSIAALRLLTATLKGPDKTQNKTQWKHIAKVARSVLDLLKIDAGKAKPVLEKKFGFDCLPILDKLIAQ